MMSAMPAAERVFFAKSELNPAHVPHVAMKKSSTRSANSTSCNLAALVCATWMPNSAINSTC